MLSTQWSEVQARYRRFLRTVGQQTLGVDEVISPTLALGEIGSAPYRGDPRAFVGFATADGAVAPNRNHVQLVLAPGSAAVPNPSCVLVRRMLINAREALPAAAVTAAFVYVAGSANADAPTVNNIQPILTEPVTGSFGVAPQPVSGGKLSLFTGSLPATPVDASVIGEKMLLGATTLLTAEFWFDPPILLATNGINLCLIGATVDGFDAGGVNPVHMGAGFAGEFFEQYPPR